MSCAQLHHAHASTALLTPPPAPRPRIQRLPITLPELVDTSPSLTDDGSVILGKRVTRVYVLDRQTGSLLQVMSDVATPGPDGKPSMDGERKGWRDVRRCG